MRQIADWQEPEACGDEYCQRQQLRDRDPFDQLRSEFHAADIDEGEEAEQEHEHGDPGRAVERLALVCGSGGEFLADAARARADAFLTGELRFHDYLAAQAQGLALVLPGHYASERVGVEELAALLKGQWPQVQVWPSRRERDPVGWC